MKTEEGDLLQTKLQQSSYHKQQEELDALKKTIGKMKRTVPDLFVLLTFVLIQKTDSLAHGCFSIRQFKHGTSESWVVIILIFIMHRQNCPLLFFFFF